MTDIIQHQTELAEEMRYAQALTTQPERGSQSLLPQAYRGNPANVLIAIGLGKAIGITPAQALYEIYVVNGRPSPSANLMAALVRRAGHRLRVEGDADKCTATLVRSDDPDFPFSATWTMSQAKAAGLANKDTWKSYPAAMLRARAISEVVRMGAPEAVIGMDYSAEEMRDVAAPQSATQEVKRVSAADFAKPTQPEPEPDTVDAEVVEEPHYAAEDPSWNATPALDEFAKPITQAQSRMLHAALKEAGMGDRDAGLAYIADVLDREVASSKELSKADASKVIDALVKSGEQA